MNNKELKEKALKAYKDFLEEREKSKRIKMDEDLAKFRSQNKELGEHLEIVDEDFMICGLKVNLFYDYELKKYSITSYHTTSKIDTLVDLGWLLFDLDNIPF